jgi:putative hydrolase of the HAD superfamily
VPGQQPPHPVSYRDAVLRALIVDYAGVLTDVDGDPRREPPILTAVRAAHDRGLRTAMISNADVGPDWLPDVFDAVVLSGEVGLAKPDVRIFRLTADKLGVATTECVFVDDLIGNVRGAVAAGMVGVHHRRADATLAELAVLLP